MLNPPILHKRCAAGTGCVEVVARTEAAMKLIYVEDDRACGEQLLAIARKIAAVHFEEAEMKAGRT